MSKSIFIALYLLLASEETSSKTPPHDGRTQKSLSSVEPIFVHDEEAPGDGSETDDGSENFVASDDTEPPDYLHEAPVVEMLRGGVREGVRDDRMRLCWFAILFSPTLVALTWALYIVLYGR